MFRSRSWFGGGIFKPKNPHSLEHLKYLHNVLSKNQAVSENNRGLLVETLRSIAEILIWGDQNDGSVFDFFLEKNMLSFFLNILKQKCGSYVCVQLLQTLNILFENIRKETSLYYLLSNNHVNSIIVHKFDFSDEEVMAYYISFLKTLSLKLNSHTVHFFYSEATNDFPLYTEAIKFFNHPESMVRIAVRTLSLNVYKVKDNSMLKFIKNKTAAPYFSNLVWFIGNHVLELDSCLKNEANHNNENRLSDLVAEHLDHLHYLNDILTLNIDDLNQVLTHHLLNNVLIPLYIYSLRQHHRQHLSSSSSSQSSQSEDMEPPKSRISSVVSLFLLSQVFLILSHVPLVHTLAHIILKSSDNIYKAKSLENGHIVVIKKNKIPGFVPPSKTLEEALDASVSSSGGPISIEDCGINKSETDLNITDEEKEQRLAQNGDLTTGIFLETIVSTLVCLDNDYTALFSLCLLYAISNNEGIGSELLESILLPSQLQSSSKENSSCSNYHNTSSNNNKLQYNSTIVDKLIDILTLSCQPGCRVRLVTLEVTILLLKKLVFRQVNSNYISTSINNTQSSINNTQSSVNNTQASMNNTTTSINNTQSSTNNTSTSINNTQSNINNTSTTITNTQSSMNNTQLNVNNSSILTNCTSTSSDSCISCVSLLSDAHYAAIVNAKEESTSLLRDFYKSEDIFLDMFQHEYDEIQNKSLNVEYLMMDSKMLLPPAGTPLTRIEFTKRLPCGEVERAKRAIRVFLHIRQLCFQLSGEKDSQLPLINYNDCVKVNNTLDLENSDLIACTVVHKDGTKHQQFLATNEIQIILVEPDLTKVGKIGWGVVKLAGFLQDIEVTGDKDDSKCLHINIHKTTSGKLLASKFIFDDHIRCMAAKQRLTKGRTIARQKKMIQIAKLLDLPMSVTPPSYMYNLKGTRNHPPLSNRSRPLFTRVPGYATPVQFTNTPNLSRDRSPHSRSSPSNSRKSLTNSGDISPNLSRPKSEEIQLSDINTRLSRYSHSPIRIQETTNILGTGSLLQSHSRKSSAGSSGTSGSKEEYYIPKTTKKKKNKGKIETV